MAIGTAAAIGLGVGALGSVISSKKNKKAATYAADQSLATAQANNALTEKIYNQNKAALTPYMNTGVAAGTNLNALLGLGTAAQADEANNDFRNYIANSDYGFKFGEGANAVNSGYAGAGTLQSGAAMKDLEQFRQNLQSGYRGEYMNALTNQQGVGFGGASALAGVGQNYANTVNASNTAASNNAINAAMIKAQNNPLANAAGLIGGGLWGMGN